MTTSTRLALVAMFLAIVVASVSGVPDIIYWPLWAAALGVAVWALTWK